LDMVVSFAKKGKYDFVGSDLHDEMKSHNKI